MMKEKDPEDLLWTLLGGSEPPSGEPPDRQMVEAYRDGRLDNAEEERIERWLATTEELRRHLIDSAGDEVRRPSAGLRERVLQNFPRENDASGATTATVLPSDRRFGGWLALAAVLLALVGFSVLWQGPSSQLLPPAHEVRLAGLVYDRSEDGSREADQMLESVEAFPSTRLVLEVEALESPSEQATYGLFLKRSGRIVQIPLDENPALQIERGPGGLRIVAEASSFLGSHDPGAYEILWVVATGPSALPSVEDLQSRLGTSDNASRRWLVYSRNVRLLPEPH